MTYREAIQIQIKALQQIYDNAEGLRDVASNENEKDAFNYLRKVLPDAWHKLQRIDNNVLTPAAAAYECSGNYSVKVTERDI